MLLRRIYFYSSYFCPPLSSHYFVGTIQKFSLYSNTNLPVAHWKMDESTGTMLANSSAFSGLDLTYTSADWALNPCFPEPEYDSLWVCTEYNDAVIDTVFNDDLLTLPIDSAESNCLADLIAEREVLINQWVEEYTDSLYSLHVEDYARKCFDSLDESFEMTFEPAEYHYTLYYYDQAGSLVQTVPPAGVEPLNAGDITKFMNGTATEVDNPAHRMVTRYQYNSLGQIVWQQTPDAGESKFWYDQIARTRLSQNAKQAAAGHYSYTRYDELGRIREVGQLEREIDNSALPSVETLIAEAEEIDFPSITAYKLDDRTITHYDDTEGMPKQDLLLARGIDFHHLRGRVSWTEVKDENEWRPLEGGEALRTFTAYSYDVHGNVEHLIQYAGELKHIQYEYDLVSGNVHCVAYQPNQEDQFMHRYRYDADNRLVAVQTSQDGYIWDTEAEYFYYAHGPLARIELGEYKVQGVDYYYTLQGWIKGVNTSGGLPSDDLGRDGLVNSGRNQHIGRDAFAYTLGYFDGDFTGIGQTPARAASPNNWDMLNATGASVTGERGLFNGNIAWMVTDLEGKGTQAMAYRYDQLNRIKSARSHEWNGIGWNTSAGKYNTNYSYDPNGNILSLFRANENGLGMDSLFYNYERDGAGNLVHNKLQSVNDLLGVVQADESDLADQVSDNYTYDEIGNLIEDKSENITSIEWNVYGKVRNVTKSLNGKQIITSYLYDGAGNRILKRVLEDGIEQKATLHTRDASGNVMQTAITKVDITDVELEYPLYGSSRLGMYRGGTDKLHRMLGNKHYELSNHLGNVLAVVSDARLGEDSTNNGQYDYYLPHIVSLSDYYPFGLNQKGRSYQSNEYRYGFNGKENDTDFGNKQIIQDYGFRLYNPSIGKFLSRDPLFRSFPWYTPYQFAGNKPIYAIDLDGLEEAPAVRSNETHEEGTKTTTSKTTRIGFKDGGASHVQKEWYWHSGSHPLHDKGWYSRSEYSMIMEYYVKSGAAGEFLDFTLEDDLGLEALSIVNAIIDNRRFQASGTAESVYPIAEAIELAASFGLTKLSRSLIKRFFKQKATTSLTFKELMIKNLDGVTKWSTEVAGLIKSGKISITVADDAIWSRFMQKKFPNASAEELTQLSKARGLYTNGNIYLRQSRSVLDNGKIVYRDLSDVTVHEGVHFIDDMKGVLDMSSAEGILGAEIRAFSAQRGFQMASGRTVTFSSRDEMINFIHDAYQFWFK